MGECRLWRGVASRDAVHLAGDVAGLLRGQQHVGGGDLGWLSGPAERRLAAERDQVLLARPATHLERRPEWTRGNRVHADAASGKLLCERLGKGDVARLGLSVVEERWGRIIALDG